METLEISQDEIVLLQNALFNFYELDEFKDASDLYDKITELQK